ncbi:MAG TPA: hypothetical protein VGF53_16695 [Pseudolabrys sp.]|jgi:hypothetical protein
MRNSTLAIAAVLACAVSHAWAQGGPGAPASEPPRDAQAAPSAPAINPVNPPSRFAFNRVDGGFLRLDNQTGSIAFCSPQPIGWACQAVPEDRAALDKEIARLQDEVASLKSELAALREPPPPRPPSDLTPAPPPGDKSEDANKLREDLARARAAFENAWRRLVEIIVNLQKDMMRKG